MTKPRGGGKIDRRGRPRREGPPPVTVVFRARPEDAEAMRAAAKADDRSLASWLRAAIKEAVGAPLEAEGDVYDGPRIGAVVSPEERDMVEAEARRCGMATATWLRAAALRRLRSG